MRIKEIAQTISGKREDEGGLKAYFLRGALGIFSIRIASIIALFALSVLLARTLGAKGFGVYAYATALVTLLGIPTNAGVLQMLVRNIAAYQTQSAWGLTQGLLRRANQAALLVSIGLALLVAIIAWSLKDRFDPQSVGVLWIALIMLPIAALTRIRITALRGLHKVVVGELPDALVRPLLLVALIGGAYLLLGSDFIAIWAVGLHVMAAGAAFVVAVVLLMRHLPQTVKEASPNYETRAWAQSAMPLLFVGGMQVVNYQTDIIMLGALKGAEAAGVYRVATRGAELILFILVPVQIALAPIIASLHATDDMKQLQRSVTFSARIVLLLSLPLGLGFILFGRWFMLVFGQEFTQGTTALSILAAGQLINVNVAMGSVGFLLTMTGHERDAAIIAGIAASINVALNAILIPRWGIEGAATATATSLVIWNVLLAMWVYRRLGIHTTALGNISLRRGA